MIGRLIGWLLVFATAAITQPALRLARGWGGREDLDGLALVAPTVPSGGCRVDETPDGDRSDGELHRGHGGHHRIKVSLVTRTFFSVFGVGGLAVLGFVSYHQYRDTGSTGGDVWFALHLPAYLVTACVCLGLLRAAFSSGDWHVFATTPPPPPPAEDPWADD